MMKTRIPALYFFLLIIITVTLGFYPITNGDIPFYIATILKKQGVPDADLWVQTKSVLKVEFPAQLFDFHADNIDHAEPGIMKFYYIKPLYGWMIFGIHQLGFSYSFSVLLPSLLAYFFIGVLLFRWIGTKLVPWQALLFSILFMLMGPLLIAARMSSPDALSNLVIFAVLYCLYQEKWTLHIYFLLFISVLVRMDNVLSVLVILTGMLFWPEKASPNKISLQTYLIGTTATILLTGGLNVLLEDNFWWILDAGYFSSAGHYVTQWQSAAFAFCNSFLFLLIIMYLMLHIGHRIIIREKNTWVLLIIAATIGVRSLLFPVLEERFFPAFYLTILIIIIDIVTVRRKRGLIGG